jgi:uncharacterized protein (TIGR04145 family)
MKKLIEKIRTLVLVIMLFGAIAPMGVSEVKAADTNISIDGYYDDWEGLPYSWEYNWNVPSYCWDAVDKKTEEHDDSNYIHVKHKMSLYSDGKYVYLNVKIASNYNSAFNGDDYQFYVDGNMARFRLTYPGGGTITGDTSKKPGIYSIEVRNGDGAISGTVVNGASAIYTVKNNNTNNEAEVKIPLTALKYQNKNINIDNFNTIEFFTPNLMIRHISCSGASTAPYTGVAISVAFVFGAVCIKKYKKRDSKVWQSF